MLQFSEWVPKSNKKSTRLFITTAKFHLTSTAKNSLSLMSTAPFQPCQTAFSVVCLYLYLPLSSFISHPVDPLASRFISHREIFHSLQRHRRYVCTVEPFILPNPNNTFTSSSSYLLPSLPRPSAGHVLFHRRHQRRRV